MSDAQAIYSEKYNLLIAGCVRKWSRDWNSLIPTEICLVIHDFYPKADKWNKDLILNGDKSKKLCLDDETQTITYKNEEGWKWMSAFGTIKVRPKDFIPTNTDDNKRNDIIVHSWRVKIHLEEYNDALEVGVALCSKELDVGSWYVDNHGGYSLSVARRKKYGPGDGVNESGTTVKFESDDIVEMVLLFRNNFEKCCLGYRHPGEDIEIAFRNLNVNEYYCLGVAFYVHLNAVQIVE